MCIEENIKRNCVEFAPIVVRECPSGGGGLCRPTCTTTCVQQDCSYCIAGECPDSGICPDGYCGDGDGGGGGGECKSDGICEDCRVRDQTCCGLEDPDCVLN